MSRYREPAAESPRRRPRAKTPEGREQELIGLAMEQAEDQLRNKVAPAPVVTHYLKLVTEREKLERSRLENENLLLKAKVEQIAAAERTQELYENAIEAMRSYTGSNEA